MFFSQMHSTLGIQQYDNRFDSNLYNGLRHTYTWPRKSRVGDLSLRTDRLTDLELDLHEQLFAHNPSNSINPGQLTHSLFEEPKSMQATSFPRSIPSSPPKGTLTPEQKELKRQRDHARRETKTQMRRERSTSNTSNSYATSQSTSPDLLAKTLPEFTNSLTPSPLLSQGSLQNSPTLGSSGFLSPFPPRAGDQVHSDIYSPVFTM